MKARLHHSLSFHEQAGGVGRFEAVLPAGAAGAWCRLTVGSVSALAEPWWAKLEAADNDRSQVVREAFLGRLHRGRSGQWRTSLVHLPSASDSLVIQVFTASGRPDAAPWATLTVLPRPFAAILLLAHGWRLLPRALAGDAMGLPGRVRTTLGQAPARDGDVPSYRVWTHLYERWGPAEREALASAPLGQDRICAVVVGADAAQRAATLASLDAQWLRPSRIASIARPAEFTAKDEIWALVLQAGERVPPHGVACFARAALLWPAAQGFYADTDTISGEIRDDPLFKPSPDPWLLRSGLLTSGGVMFRASALERQTAALDAQAWRLSTAQTAGAEFLRRIPRVLTHLPAPAAIFHNVLRRSSKHSPPTVSIIMPSAAQSRHVLRCVRQLVATTAYPHLEILVAVSRIQPGNGMQERVITALRTLPHVRVIGLDMNEFNYATVNNTAARMARGEFLLLLNDDVVPVRRDWLNRMVAYANGPTDERADMVGARLLYGNGTVQHGGVILGLANLCEHAFRLAPSRDPGPYGMALLDRQITAVTGACMLLRRSLYETLGGLDPAFAIALNDVDFCLRAGAHGARIVMAAEVTMYHYESLSLGRHYKGGRAALEAVEIGRLRQRWKSVIAADPFYHPCASLIPGQEFKPSFPPRCTPLSWTGGEMP